MTRHKMTDCIISLHTDASMLGRVVCSTKPDSGRVGFPDLLEGRYYRVGRNLPQDRVCPFLFSATNFNETDRHREVGGTVVSCLHRYVDLNSCSQRSCLECLQRAPDD